MKFKENTDYAIDGEAMRKLWRISERFNDGRAFASPDERRNFAQQMQLMLDRACELTPELCKSMLMHETNSDIEN
jgi:hypothetical protein